MSFHRTRLSQAESVVIRVPPPAFHPPPHLPYPGYDKNWTEILSNESFVDLQKQKQTTKLIKESRDPLKIYNIVPIIKIDPKLRETI